MLRSIVSAVATLLLSVGVAQAQTYTYNFCYGQYNTLMTSPYGPWNVQTSGRLSVTNITNYWLVTGASGQRVMTYQGGQQAYSQILGVAPVNSYAYNTNAVNIVAPFLSGSNTITFTMSNSPVFAGGRFIDTSPFGMASLNGYVAIQNYTIPNLGNGMSELNQPINDGVTNIITSYFDMRLLVSGTIYNCPYTANVPLITTSLQSYFTTPTSWNLCVQHVGGPGGDGTVNGGNWTITTSVVLTTSSYAGVTTNGLTAYLVTGAAGTRTYQQGNTIVTSNVNNIASPSGLFNLQMTQVGDFSLGSADTTFQLEGFGGFSNNILYTTFPYTDSYGINFYTSQPIFQELFGTSYLAGGTASTNVYRIATFAATVDGYNGLTNVAEYLMDFSWLVGYVFLATNAGGAMVLSSGGTSTISAFAAQCAFAPTYASATTTPVTFEWCYYLDNTNSGTGSLVSAYGEMQAFGPITRQGRTNAYQVLSMNGVRQVLNYNGGAISSTSTDNIVSLEFPDFNGMSVDNVNTNWLYATAPYVDAGGLLFVMDKAAVYPNGGASTVHVSLFQASATTFMEQDLNGGSGVTPATSKFLFSFSSSTRNPLATCNAANALVPTPPTTTVYSFCYYHLGSTKTFVAFTYGTLSVWNQAVTGANGVAGYPVKSVLGVYQSADNTGILSVNNITGVASGYQASQMGYTVTTSSNPLSPFFSAPNQIVYPTGNSGITSGSSVVDFRGLLFQYSGQGAIPGYYDTVAPLTKLAYDQSSNAYGYTEDTVYTITVNTSTANALSGANPTPTYYSEILIHGSMGLAADNGVSGQSGAVLSATCNAPVTIQLSFCYTITQSNANSPWLSWTVTTTGLLQVSPQYTQGEYGSAYSYGFLVQSGSGTRTITQLNKQTSQSWTVAPVNAYNFNDNIINLAAPYFDTSTHSLSLIMNSGVAAVFADGTLSNGSPYVNINGYTAPASNGAGITESDLPVNDGLTNTINSQFFMAYDNAGTNTCPLTVTNYVAPTQAQMTAYNTAGPQYAFCWSHTGGPGGYGTTDGSAWQITSSGIFQTAGWLGTTGDGRSGYKIIGISQGTRTYTFNNGSTQVVTLTAIGKVFSMGSVSSLATGQFEVGSFGSYFYSNNVLYTTYPQLDNWGVSLIGASQFDEEQETVPTGVIRQGDANENVIRVLIQPGFNNMLEYLWDPPTQYIWTNNGGYAQFAVYTNQNIASFGTQCLYLANGAPLSAFSYCYWLTGTNFVTGAPYTIYSYGTAMAVGPSIREASSNAYAISSMTGIRSVTVNGVTTVQNIMNIQYPNQDLQYNTANTNLLFPSQQPSATLDGMGVTFTLNSQPLLGQGGAVDANGFQTSSDINLWIAQPYGMYESSGNYAQEISQTAYIYTQAFGFSMSPYTSGGPLQQCSSSAIPVIPATQTYSFAYGLLYNRGSNAQYVVGLQGTITVYSTPIMNNGRIGYGIANITGTRMTQASNNNSVNTVTVTGVSADWIAGQQNWTMNQIFYPVAPYFDGTGALLKFSGQALSASGVVIPRDPVIKLLYNNYPGGQMAEQVFLPSGQTYNASTYAASQAVAYADNGASASTLLASMGLTFPYNFNTNPLVPASSSSASSSSSTSSLSNGAIAGIVIGVVFGVIFTLLLCAILICVSGHGGKSSSLESATTKSKYNSHQDEPSKYNEESAVEMQTADA